MFVLVILAGGDHGAGETRAQELLENREEFRRDEAVALSALHLNIHADILVFVTVHH